MSSRGTFEYKKIKRKPEQHEETQQKPQKILVPPSEPKNATSIPTARHKKAPSKKCEPFPDMEISLTTNYSVIPIESRLEYLTEEISNIIRSKVVELYQDHPALISAACFMMDSIITRTKKSQKGYHDKKRQREIEIQARRENLSKVLIKENEIWTKVLDIYSVNPRNVSPVNKIRYLESLEKKLSNTSSRVPRSISKPQSKPLFPYDKEYTALAPKIRNKRIDKVQYLLAYAQDSFEIVKSKKMQNAYNALADFHLYLPITTANPVDLLSQLISCRPDD